MKTPMQALVTMKTPMQPLASETELAYLAGIIDGEGCVYVPKSTARDLSPEVIISNTDMELLAWIQVRFGGRLREASGRAPMARPRTKVCYELRWRGSTLASGLLKPVLPYLIVKKPKAEAALLRAAELRQRRIEQGRRLGIANIGRRRLAVVNDVQSRLTL
jgi:hypothetical protein